MGEQNHSKCLQCNRDNEAKNYVISFPADSAMSCQRIELEQLEGQLINNYAEPTLRDQLLIRLEDQRVGSSTEIPSHQMLTYVINQDEIRWNKFTFGIVAKSWAIHQETYLQCLNKCSSGTMWMSKLI